MRIFNNLSETVSEVTREVYEMGIRVCPETMQDKFVGGNVDYETKELMGYSYMLKGPQAYLKVLEEISTHDKRKYVETEYWDRISSVPVNPGNSWHHRKEVWNQFLEPNGKFSYTYSERMEVLGRAIEQLRNARDTRQVIIPIYRVVDTNRWGKRRIPCSMHYQFMARNESLNLVYVMRSCDIHTHFEIDVALALLLLDYVAFSVGLRPGNLYHQIGSLHVYRKDAQPGVF